MRTALLYHGSILEVELSIHFIPHTQRWATTVSFLGGHMWNPDVFFFFYFNFASKIKYRNLTVHSVLLSSLYYVQHDSKQYLINNNRLCRNTLCLYLTLQLLLIWPTYAHVDVFKWGHGFVLKSAAVDAQQLGCIDQQDNVWKLSEPTHSSTSLCMKILQFIIQQQLRAPHLLISRRKSAFLAAATSVCKLNTRSFSSELWLIYDLQ